MFWFPWQVFIRVRPPNDMELADGKVMCKLVLLSDSC